VWCGDQHQLDLMVINPDRDGQLDRPWVTAFMDMRTRALVGWHISFDHNSDTNIFAFIHGVRPKVHPIFEHLCGLPDRVYVDNGKDYRSTRFELACDRNGVAITHAKVRNAKAKPVERFFGTLCLQFSQGFETYLGNRPGNRTERTQELVKEHEAWLANKRRAKTPFKTLAELKHALRRFRRRVPAASSRWPLRRRRRARDVAGGRVASCAVKRRANSRSRLSRVPHARELRAHRRSRLHQDRQVVLPLRGAAPLRRAQGALSAQPGRHHALIVYDEHDRKRICVAKALTSAASTSTR
jgi:hypothetical protein